MKKPDVDLSTLSIGKIFQIDPGNMNDPVSIRYGGDFIISVDYNDIGVQGYLALVSDQEGVVRKDGLVCARIRWELLQCVGCAEWFKKDTISSSEIQIEQSQSPA